MEFVPHGPDRFLSLGEVVPAIGLGIPKSLADDCSRGEWQQLVGRYGHKGLLPFKSTLAHYLMAIAKDQRIVQHAELLPKAARARV